MPAVPYGSIAKIESWPIAEHPGYSVLSLGLGAGSSSRYWLYFFPSQVRHTAFPPMLGSSAAAFTKQEACNVSAGSEPLVREHFFPKFVVFTCHCVLLLLLQYVSGIKIRLIGLRALI
jgi:hypothetical protein